MHSAQFADRLGIKEKTTLGTTENETDDMKEEVDGGTMGKRNQ